MMAPAASRSIRSADAQPVLVTGAAGFVGSHLCDRLIEAGCSVIGLDDLSTGTPSHLSALQGHARFRFVRHDVREPLPDAVRDVGAIFNLACPASPAYYTRHPVHTVLSSAQGAWRLLELARRNGARLLQASTSEVYGNPQVHPQPESYWGHVNPFGPRACYDEGKRCAEALCHAYASEHGVDIRIARLFNCYGPRLRPGDGRVVSNFIVQALEGRPLTVYGNGTQSRSFCYVDDTVQGLLLLMDSAVREPVNLGNPHEHTMLQLAALVLRLTGSTARMEHLPLPTDDPTRRRPDITRAMARLGWQPSISLQDGLQRTIEHFRALQVASTDGACTPGATDAASIAPITVPAGARPLESAAKRVAG